MPITPVTAITTFLPIVERQKAAIAFIAVPSLEGGHQLAYRVRALLERRPLVSAQLDLDDALESLSAELAGDAEEDARHAVLALEPGGAGEDALLVADDRLDHLHGTGGRRVVGRSRLQMPDDLRAAVPRALDDSVEGLAVEEAGDRNAAD